MTVLRFAAAWCALSVAACAAWSATAAAYKRRPIPAGAAPGGVVPGRNGTPPAVTAGAHSGSGGGVTSAAVRPAPDLPCP